MEGLPEAGGRRRGQRAIGGSCTPASVGLDAGGGATTSASSAAGVVTHAHAVGCRLILLAVEPTDRQTVSHSDGWRTRLRTGFLAVCLVRPFPAARAPARTLGEQGEAPGEGEYCCTRVSTE